MICLKAKLGKLPKDKIAELELIVDAIIETKLAEIIVLFGSYARGNFKDGKIIDVGGYRVQRRSDYDILAVVDQPDEDIERRFVGFFRPERIGAAEIEIRKKLKDLDLPVQIIVEQIGEINRRLEDKQYFYSDISREGIVLFDTDKCRLSEPPEEITPTVRLKYAEDEFDGWVKEATEFWKVFKLVHKERMHRKAAFMLEQALRNVL